jgi:hypothetical protein
VLAAAEKTETAALFNSEPCPVSLTGRLRVIAPWPRNAVCGNADVDRARQRNAVARLVGQDAYRVDWRSRRNRQLPKFF